MTQDQESSTLITIMIQISSLQTVEVFRMLRSSIDPFHCTFIVGIVQLAATGCKYVWRKLKMNSVLIVRLWPKCHQMCITQLSVPVGGGPGGQAGAADDLGHGDGGLHGGPRHLPHPGGGRARCRHIAFLSHNPTVPSHSLLILCRFPTLAAPCPGDRSICGLLSWVRDNPVLHHGRTPATQVISGGLKVLIYHKR